jgi:hypothetical protein
MSLATEIIENLEAGIESFRRGITSSHQRQVMEKKRTGICVLF